ncbi:TonB-dependent siderophore receptor [Herbaspirillum sp. alder98]|uniref:TonB-dependent siderophore receptor n=1 Tax=Herbaspirillum sp. alder98 TaxID=2913096 RepID=UPI001CD83C8F|nr:TonB-dependent receptor [Herbaspirillum sp. alder98]MCA1324913.1 TonB-dependent receptor [Herbaspirillum sp. alder98]
MVQHIKPARPLARRQRRSTGSNAMRRGRAVVLLGALASAASYSPSSAVAQSVPAPLLIQYQISPGPLADVLAQFASRSGISIAIPPELVHERRSQGLKGSYSIPDGFTALLQATDLEAVTRGDRAYALRRRAASVAASDSAPLPTIAVTAAATLDPTTEGTSSYTSGAVSIGKSDQKLKDIPQSVSVLTRQRMDDQNLVSLGESMRYVTGMRSNQTGTGLDNIESRGFLIGNYLIDGLPVKGGQGVWGNNLMDMGLYDRAEIWRGPTGLLEGAGEPSGTINLVRKRAHAEFAAQAAVTLGSWNQKRAEFDITGALNQDGTLRARLVAIHDDRDSFTDRVWMRKETVYGTLEYDFTRDTTLSLGATGQSGSSLVYAGLPLTAGGINPDLPRSTFLGSTNGTKRDYGQRYFAELEHRLADGGKFKLSANQYLRGTTLDRFWSNSYINPVTRNVTIRGQKQRSREEDRDLDAFLLLPATFGGLRQEFVVGANYQTYEGGQVQGNATSFQQNVDNPNLNLVIPDVDPGPTPRTRVIQYGVYTQARLKPWQPLSVLLGGRMAWWKTTDPDVLDNNQTISAKFVPNVGLILALNPHYSLYASFNRIFAPQTARAVDQSLLAPRSGKQVEAGIKGEFMEGQLNGHVAVFRINDTNRAITDPSDSDYSIAAGEVESQGMEAEISGRLTRQWDLSAGYAYTATRYVNAALDSQGTPFNSAFPRHNVTLWTKYRFGPGALEKASIGGGMRAISKISAQYGSTTWTQSAYAVFALQAGWEISPKVNASLTVNNLFDKSYFERLGGGQYRQTYYGEPRSVTLAIRAKY